MEIVGFEPTQSNDDGFTGRSDSPTSANSRIFKVFTYET